jgi:asparagine synthase (glutamine-hydrolysing)
VCGIAGCVAPPGQRADRAVLERMIATLRHRGPDSIGFHVAGRVGLATARLRVIDLETGDQPIANEDGSVHVVLNGEIYNFRQLRDELAGRGHEFRTRSDTETLVHLWEDHGKDTVDHLNGMFAFALWDARRGALILARDRMGEKPLYWTVADGWLVFGSEMTAVLAHPAISQELDPAGLSRYLAFDFVPAPHTIVRDVAKLPPGHRLIALDGQIRVERYWEIPFVEVPPVDDDAWCGEIRRRFDDAVRARLVSDVPLGCFLSGGVDSTAVVATAARFRSGLRTFSIGFDDRAYDERGFARRVAGRLGTIHEELLMSAADAVDVVPRLGELLDEPIADMSFVPLYLLSAAARKDVTVALTGDGGDELFAGYPTMAAEWWHAAFAGLPRLARRLFRALGPRLPDGIASFREFLAALDYPEAARNQALLGGLAPERHRALLSREARAALGDFDAYGDLHAALAPCASDDPISRLIFRYCKLYLAGQNLMNADRASMAVGLELRAPFLDHTFVEFLGRVPPRLKLRGVRNLKWLLKRALADRLPPETLARGKHGFDVPFGAWFRGPLATLLRDVLSPGRLRAVGLFDVAAVERLVTEHLEGRRDHPRVLWALLTFELWRTHRN